MIERIKAAVRPRVILGGTRGEVLLEDLVAEMRESGIVRVIELFGSPGAGTTTALQHLAFVFGTNEHLIFVDRNRPANSYDHSGTSGGVLFPRCTNHVTIRCKLMDWSRDEWIEYLLATRKEQCQSVMKRVLKDTDIGSLGGNPSLLRQVLDELASDEHLPGVKSAFDRIIESHFPNLDERRILAPWLMDVLARNGIPVPIPTITTPIPAFENLSKEQARLLHQPAVQLRLATEVLWLDLQDRHSTERNSWRWPRELIASIAERVAESPTIQDKLHDWIRSSDRNLHPIAVSLLHTAKVPWKLPWTSFFPVYSEQLHLDGAILDGADCTPIPLSKCSMKGASFERASLVAVDLQHSLAWKANFRDADLRQATLTGFDGRHASLAGANLSGCFGQQTCFSLADLSLADLTDAQLEHGDFRSANLTQADLRRADLTQSNFLSACLDEADFSAAKLDGALLEGLDLTVASFEQASFRGALMRNCNLEGMKLPDADFVASQLVNANLTGSVMPRANFRNAVMQFVKLADVNWESVNLRNADLTGATFHMGSSRSGLVGSSVPMFGSRTGFYTDEFHEQDFKAPEEIRTANLRGADLRGAVIDDVDFYLVDLRDAIYDQNQAEQFRRSGAILETRTSG